METLGGIMINKYKFTSTGAAKEIEVGFEPDTIEVFNATKFATDDAIAKSYFHKGMSAGTALNDITANDALVRSISATDGFTVTANSSFSSNQSAISGITKANPAVVTVASTSGWTTGDVVRLKNVAGMTNVNNVDYKIVVIDGTTFSLTDMNGNAIDSSAFEAYVAAADDAAVNLSLKVVDNGGYKITLGTDVVGANNDVMYVECRKAYINENV